jgi:hypothetical protein
MKYLRKFNETLKNDILDFDDLKDMLLDIEDYGLVSSIKKVYFNDDNSSCNKTNTI